MVELVLDVALGSLLLILAAGALFGRTLFACAALFIGFGVLLALAWARLDAVDLALAEAAIGAGLTGALLLHAIAIGEPEPRQPFPRKAWFVAGGGALAVVAALFAYAFLNFGGGNSTSPAEPAALALKNLSASGVSHPVTAVLLNFRAWDTLLELAVLLAALLGVRHLHPLEPVAMRAPWPLLAAWSKTLAPVVVVAAGYILWRGSSGPGGAFQAGALLAAGAVLLRLCLVPLPLRWSATPTRLLVLSGLAVFVSSAAATQWLGEGWLSFPTDFNTALIVAIEAAATVSIGATLALLVTGGEGELHS